MSLNSPKDILNSYGIKPAKAFGQNFLINKGILDKIVKSADIKPDDTIIEIGPGLGILTIELAKKANKVIAVEKDKKMVEILKERLKDFKNVEIIHEDALKLSGSLLEGPTFQYFSTNSGRSDPQMLPNYKVVANLPYNVANAIIRMFLEAKNPPELMVLMVQKEVGQRICASPPQMSILAVAVQLYGKPEIISYVSAGSFWPMPKVDSAVLKITNIQKPKINTDLFFKIMKAGFSQPRKQITGNFNKVLALSPSNGLKLNKLEIQNWLAKNNIQPNQRAETLSIQNWLDLTKTCNPKLLGDRIPQ